MWQFPLLIHLNAKAIESCIREQNKLLLSQLCNKSTSSRILTKHATHGPESNYYKLTSNRERSKTQIVLYTRALR